MTFFSPFGFPCVVISQERFYFGDNILPCFESGIPLLKNRLQQLPDSDNVSISFSGSVEDTQLYTGPQI